eukprot:184653-Chlamydomonas_euryale.AAC.2
MNPHPVLVLERRKVDCLTSAQAVSFQTVMASCVLDGYVKVDNTAALAWPLHMTWPTARLVGGPSSMGY